jgi:CMP-2-keto-3-deoxyoctulosonic acid synthetase
MTTTISTSMHGAVRAIRHAGDHVVVAGEDRATLHEISRYGAKQIMTVSLAPSIRSRIRSVTAKEILHPPDLRRIKNLHEAPMNWPLPHLHGRFWDDSDS